MHAGDDAGAAAPPVVALVGSAGGLEALIQVLGHLPTDLPAAIIVLLHQSPEYANTRLVDILDRACALPVRRAVEGGPLICGEAVVIPPGRHMLIQPDLRVKLIVSGTPPPSRPSADLLLSTLAISARERAIAVVLSGGGHDGATGATAIHACGGCVIASDRASSQSFGMPGATIERDDVINHVVPLGEISTKLVELAVQQTTAA